MDAATVFQWTLMFFPVDFINSTEELIYIMQKYTWHCRTSFLHTHLSPAISALSCSGSSCLPKAQLNSTSPSNPVLGILFTEVTGLEIFPYGVFLYLLRTSPGFSFLQLSAYTHFWYPLLFLSATHAQTTEAFVFSSGLLYSWHKLTRELTLMELECKITILVNSTWVAKTCFYLHLNCTARSI